MGDVNAILKDAMQGDHASIRAFSEQEIHKISKIMKHGKAAGWDGIYYEHILYSPMIIHKALAILFNSINAHRYVPICFKRGVIVPILKSKTKAKEIKDNYIGITHI